MNYWSLLKLLLQKITVVIFKDWVLQLKKKNSHLQNREAEKLHCYTTTVICNLIHHNGMINSSSHVIFARWVCLVDFKTYHHLLGHSILISIIYYTWFKVNICWTYTWVCKNLFYKHSSGLYLSLQNLPKEQPLFNEWVCRDAKRNCLPLVKTKSWASHGIW